MWRCFVSLEGMHSVRDGAWGEAKAEEVKKPGDGENRKTSDKTEGEFSKPEFLR